VAIATSSEETAVPKAKALSVPKAYGNYLDLINSDIDVVQITSPNYLHFPQAKAALEAGKHVVCDKPLVTSSGESRVLVDLAREKGWQPDLSRQPSAGIKAAVLGSGPAGITDRFGATSTTTSCQST